MRIESVEQIELGNIMELSIAGQVLRWARQSNLSGGVSMRKADGWNMKNHSHLTVARHLPEKIHPIVLIVTIREGEEKEMCSAAMRELLRIIKDQVGEGCAVAMVLSRKSTIWRRAIVKTLLRKRQMKYIDVEGMRVVTNDKHIAERIKSDSAVPARECLLNRKVENVVMNGPEVGKLEKEQNLKSIVMDGVKKAKGDMVQSVVMDGTKVGKFGKLKNYTNVDETMSQSEERVCKSIIRGLVKRNHEKHTMLADVGEEQEQDVISFDDITGKELPWHAVREARELELKYSRDLGVYEKVDKKEAVEKYGITPVDTKWVDTDKAFEEEPMQIRSRMCAREFKSDDRPDLYAGTPPLEPVKAIISVAADHEDMFSIMHIDVSRAYFHAKAQRSVLIRLPVEDRMGTDAGKVGLMKKSMYGTRDAASNGERDWQGHVQKWGFQLGLSSNNLFHHKEDRVSGLTHGDDFVLTGPTEKLVEFERKMTSVYPIKAKIISHGSPKNIKTLNRLHWGNRGIVYQHDPRHVDVLVKDFGLEHRNSVQTPATPDVMEEGESEPSSQVQHQQNRSQVTRCLYLSQDRADMTFIVNELCQKMSSPNQQSLAKLKRLAMYLKSERQWRQVFECGKMAEELAAFTDSDWAGCKETRKSSSAGVLMLGGHTWKAYTRKQKVIAESSAEADLYAAALGASERESKT